MAAPSEEEQEKKRKRLEAWRKRQEEKKRQKDSGGGEKKNVSVRSPVPMVKASSSSKSSIQSTSSRIKLSLVGNKNPLLKPLISQSSIINPRKRRLSNDADDEHETDEDELRSASHKKPVLLTLRDLSSSSTSARPPLTNKYKQASGKPNEDQLDLFMRKLTAGAHGTITTHLTSVAQGPMGTSAPTTTSLSIDTSGSMMKSLHKPITSQPTPTSTSPLFTPSDWESDVTSYVTSDVTSDVTNTPHSKHYTDADDDEEEEEIPLDGEDHPKWLALRASKRTSAPTTSSSTGRTNQEIMMELLQQQHKQDLDNNTASTEMLAADVKSEKARREDRLHQLEREAADARKHRFVEDTETGMYLEEEGGVMEEAERNLSVVQTDLAMGGNVLEVLSELNKKKELKAVDHSQVDYYDIQKNLYLLPRHLATLKEEDIINRRAKLHIKVRGVACPAPVDNFKDCGLPERILSVLERQQILNPFAVQAQCLPAIMAGRDVIAIAKTGSGKTLAYLLPLLRHVLAQQPPLQLGVETGPMALILAPARELATQIHGVCRVFCKALSLKSTAVYGGGGVAEQIADLKRGCHIVVATPGRIIDLLTMQAGKLLTLQRVSFVVMDEADRMFDMGFAPQISAILAAIRPDRQTVLFSATFPKLVEKLARQSLRYPLEVLVGGRSIASDSITQYAELIDEDEKFLRLLQLLGEYITNEGDSKVIVFVDTQLRADTLFERLMKCGYPSLSLHGGKDQQDRDSTIADFKNKDGTAHVLVATSVAGRGLDVPSCTCVINYSAPNHLEDYVHRVGRTGRANTKGVAYTFCNSVDEAKFAPIVVRALSEAGQAENISKELRDLSDQFKQDVKSGKAKWAGSGYKGKGYTYDASELSDTQKLAQAEKREALIEAGMLDPEAEDARETLPPDGIVAPIVKKETQPIQLSAELLQLPGMQEAIMRKAGMLPSLDGLADGVTYLTNVAANHHVAEMEINDYPQQARWKVTQKDTTSRLQDDCATAVTLKGQYFPPGKEPAEGERRLYLHLEAQTNQSLRNCVHEIRRILNEETLKVSGSSQISAQSASASASSSMPASSRYSVI